MKFKSKIVILIVLLVFAVSLLGFGSYKYLKEQKELNKIAVINKDIPLEEARRNNELLGNRKVTIYLFYGKSCPHCEDLLNYLESLKGKYGKYFTVYAFEVWYNKENGELMDKFLQEFGGEVGSRSVPYYIVGDEVMSGYIPSMSTKVKDKILEKYKERKHLKNFQDILNNEKAF